MKSGNLRAPKVSHHQGTARHKSKQNDMPCLLEGGHKLSLNVDFKEEATRTLIGVFVSAFSHYFLERFVFTVRIIYEIIPNLYCTVSFITLNLADRKFII